MADFYQSGIVTTLNILGDKGMIRIEKDLNKYSKRMRTTILIPVLYSDYIRPAMKRTLEILEDMSFIHQVILSLGRASEEEFIKVKEEVKNHPIKITVLWMDNPKIKKLMKKLEDADLKIGPEGKGKSCWTGFGLVLAQGDSDIIALHDSDIETYSKEMVARLIYPLVNPHLPYDFSKGFYARFSDKLHGRVTRLFVIPFLKSLMRVLGLKTIINYLNSFRYPLSGEFALRTGLARVMRFPGDWGLEVSVLYEVYRNVTLKRIAQVELIDRYDHKHQKVSERDASLGLNKMTRDIATNVLKSIAAEGIILSEGVLKTIQKTYLKIAEDMIPSYHADAMMNGLKFDRHQEETLIETFYRALIQSSDEFLEDPLGVQMLPNWIRITSAYPRFLDQLKNIVDSDNK
jgi:glucosyl-3-phosphoglycerate synthase